MREMRGVKCQNRQKNSPLVVPPLRSSPQLSGDVDLMHPPAALELQKHKLKRLVQSPNSFFMDVKCQVRVDGAKRLRDAEITIFAFRVTTRERVPRENTRDREGGISSVRPGSCPGWWRLLGFSRRESFRAI